MKDEVPKGCQHPLGCPEVSCLCCLLHPGEGWAQCWESCDIENPDGECRLCCPCCPCVNRGP